jgi:hypothetical protein
VSQVIAGLLGWLLATSAYQSAAVVHLHGISKSINALAEIINGLYKTEGIRRHGPWRSLEAVEFATLEWVDWFNHRRRLEPIGNIPPAEAEARYYYRTPAKMTASVWPVILQLNQASAWVSTQHLFLHAPYAQTEDVAMAA